MAYYDGILEFHKWARSLPTLPSFDWADLTESERRMWARYEKDQEKMLDNQEKG